jgi:hypothetical protein
MELLEHLELMEKLFRLLSRHLRFCYGLDYEKGTLVVITIEPISRMYH